ncbi:MAG: M56 family metallopeptidase [Planctomycetaceae bacterium]
MSVFTSNAFESLARIAMLSAAIYGTVLLVIAFATSLLLRRSSAALRHRLWSATFLALLLLPLLSMSLPALLVPIDVEPVLQHSDAMFGPSVREQVVRFVDDKTQSASKPVEKSVTTSTMPNLQGTPSETLASSSWRFPELSFAQFAAITWAFVAAILLAGIVYGARQTRCYARRSRPIIDDDVCRQFDDLCRQLKVNRPVRLLESAESVIPMTWGILSPTVLLPAEARTWSPDLRRSVLLHELAHVQRNDVAMQLLGRVVCALYWFHPLARVALNKLRVEREQACDDAVLCAGERPSDYALRLVEIARLCSRKRPFSLAVGFIQGGKLERRVRALLDQRRSHLPLSRRGACVMLSSVVLIAVAMAAVRLTLLASPPAKNIGPPYNVVVTEGALKYRMRVVDPSGSPVEGAKLDNLAYTADSLKSGSTRLWEKEWPADFVSDADGLVTIHVPDVSKAIGEGWGIVLLHFGVRHQDFPYKNLIRKLDDADNVTLEAPLHLNLSVVREGAGDLLTKNLYVQTSGIFGTGGQEVCRWEVDDELLKVRAVSPSDPTGGRYLRVIHAPEGEAPWFSDLIDANEYANQGETVYLDITIYPGARVEGKLSANVPRPVTGGTVRATIMEASKRTPWPWRWYDFAEVHDDGSFVFPSLPRNCDLDLCAECDGWVSTIPNNDEVKAYAARHNSNLLYTIHTNRTNRDVGQLIRLTNSAVSRHELAMQETGECEIIAIMEDGRPVENIKFTFASNQSGYVLGTAFSQLERLKNADMVPLMETDWWKALWENYSGVTDDDGRLVIRELPDGFIPFSMVTDEYEIVHASNAPSSPQSDIPNRRGRAEILPGRITRITITLKRTE